MSSFIKIKSFVQDHGQVVPADVEISLIGGLPQIVFLGLPDQAIKESAHRIKNAIREQGYDFPKAKSMIVNIRPNHFKKTSRGLELAVAFGILYLTKQIQWKKSLENYYFYGELSLSGEVIFPDDFINLPLLESGQNVITGWMNQSAAQPTLQIKNLKSFDHLFVEGPNNRSRFCQEQLPVPERPKIFQHIEFSSSQALWIKLIAVGWHPTMIAGSAGTGKSMVLKALSEFLEEPSAEDLFEISRRNIRFDMLKWRPSIAVHHTATPLSMVGGGGVPHPGELYRAHKGILLLDEFLEFSKKVQEVLRGPMEEGIMRISRSTQVQDFPFETLIVGTTNLCPCGEWLPYSSNNCGRTLFKCRSYRERLSGPVLDRFQLLFFSFPVVAGVVEEIEDFENRVEIEDSENVKGAGATKKTATKFSKKSILGSDLLDELLQVYEFQKERQERLQQSHLVKNSRLSWSDLEKGVDPKALRLYFSENIYNPRRKLAILSVARTLADLEFSFEVKSKHLSRAIKYAGSSFERLKTLS